MSDIHLHHDLYHEASGRRAREAHTRVRDQQDRRAAGRRFTVDDRAGMRVRIVALVARAMGVAEQVRFTAPSQRPAATRHGH